MWPFESPKTKKRKPSKLDVELAQARAKSELAKRNSKEMHSKKEDRIDTLNEATNMAQMATLQGLTPEQQAKLNDLFAKRNGEQQHG